MRLRGLTVAGALCALATAGCGLGSGESVGEVELTVTRDYGATTLVRRGADATESDTAMRVLDASAEISTRYGGRFVQSIEGIEGGRDDGRALDWFFYVNGVESPVGAAEYGLHDGDRVWWDYRDWTDAMRVPAVVGSFPEPLLHGYEGRRHPVQVRCMGAGQACGLVRARLREHGVGLSTGSGDPIRVLVGTWARLRRDGAAALIERGPAQSGVFARLSRSGAGYRLIPLDAAADPAGSLGSGTGLLAATREGDEPPTWIVTGTDRAGTRSAARLLDETELRDSHAVAVAGKRKIPLPVR